MRLSSFLSVVAASLWIITGSTPAFASCSLPYAISNGQPADATQVMADFNSLLTCINSPAAGSTNSLQINGGSGSLGAVSPLSDGQIAIGATGGPPQAATLTAGAGISITNTAGSVTIATNGGIGTMPVVRGVAAQASSNSQYTVTWPTGTQAGDFAVIFYGHGWPISTPSGWVTADNEAGSYWNGGVFYRVLSNSDLTAGSVGLSAQNGGPGTVAIVTFVGATGGLRDPGVFLRSSSSPASPTVLDSDGSPLTTDVALYFGSNRATSTNTVSLGNQLISTSSGDGASSILNAGPPAAAGGVSPSFTYSVPGSAGFYNAAVFVKTPGT